MLDVSAIRRDFPILSQQVYGHPLTYLDNGATTQVPQVVIERVANHYATANGNVHRGSHYMAAASTKALEAARSHVARFIGAPSADCVVFTRGTTEALNTVASGLRCYVKPGDHVVSTLIEHHSNYVPFQQLAFERGAEFDVCGITETGDLDLEHLARLLEMRPKIVAVTCCSNVLGTVTPIERICAMAHDAGALVVLDGAQIMRHRVIDIQQIGCDFFAFSGHKMMAGTGIGVLCGTQSALELLRPSEFGGEMVESVTQPQTEFSDLPLRLEAGTPNYVGSLALDAAMTYLESIGREEIARYEDELLVYAEARIRELPGAHVQGSPAHRAGCVSFLVDDVHPFDLCALVDKLGVALRSGHNCAQPILDHLKTSSVTRLSPAFYNTREEIDYAASCLERGIRTLRAARTRT